MGLEQVRRQHAEGKGPCVDREHCHAETGPARGLILSDNVIIARQILTMLGSVCGWKMTSLRRDKEAYALIMNGDIDVVIADISSTGLGGLAVLSYVRQRWPSIAAYAIAQRDDHFLQKLARDMGGCLGFFHRVKGRAELDTRTGMAAELLSRDIRP